MIQAERNERWRDTARLALVTVVVLAVLVLFLLALAEPAAGGYPLGFVVAASGLPLAAMLLVFWFARRQERIDQRHGLYED